MVKFLLLALFYGDHPALAMRCCMSLRALWNTGEVDVRIGLNAVSPRTRAVVERMLPGVDVISADPQIYKFPMMRRLAFDYRGDATHMMWFDDDSCLLPGVEPRAWLRAVTQRAATATGSLGALYTQAVTPAQKEWMRRQPWYAGRDIPDALLFNTGGWLVVPLGLMRRFDWPNTTLHHAAGDIDLGALLQQHGLQPQQFRMGLAINADASLRESSAPRRGVTEPAHVDSHRVWGDMA